MTDTYNQEPALEKQYLGIDLSTQKIKAVVVNDGLNVVHQASVHYDSELPEFRTHGGFVQKGDAAVVSPIMWIKALDMLLDKLRVCGLNFESLASVTGCAQQHGSVFWRKGALNSLNSLRGEKFLHDQLLSAFSTRESPIWVDSSTTDQCLQLEAIVGGPQVLSSITGSRAYERFTANQILKHIQKNGDIYHNCERISLISSFLCSLLLGSYASIDESDGSGMNLMDLKSKTWDPTCMKIFPEDLPDKLGPVVSSCKTQGKICSYFVDRYEFSKECQVTSFLGDNLASAVGMSLKPGDVIFSLGTSDTVLIWLDDPHPQLEGHVFCNPLDPSSYVGLLCYKNGSLLREEYRNELADGSWDIFNQLLDSVPRGNFGNIGMFYDKKEILPKGIQGKFRFNKSNEPVKRFTSNETEIRALIEGQFLAKRIHMERIGFDFNNIGRVLVTGGASVNKGILQVLSDVFNCSAYSFGLEDSACYGAALWGKFVTQNPNNDKFSEVIQAPHEPLLVCNPSKDAKNIYREMAKRFKELEENIIHQFDK